MGNKVKIFFINFTLEHCWKTNDCKWGGGCVPWSPSCEWLFRVTLVYCSSNTKNLEWLWIGRSRACIIGKPSVPTSYSAHLFSLILPTSTWMSDLCDRTCPSYTKGRELVFVDFLLYSSHTASSPKLRSPSRCSPCLSGEKVEHSGISKRTDGLASCRARDQTQRVLLTMSSFSMLLLGSRVLRGIQGWAVRAGAGSFTFSGS